jgi:riboflavin kinase/FMN adenylyltransferase
MLPAAHPACNFSYACLVRNGSLTIGTFDGVHLGHQALVRRAAQLAQGASVHVLCFDPHPAITLRPQSLPARIMTFDRKRELLLACGATHVTRLVPEPAFLASSAREFFDYLLRTFAPAAIVEGPDFQFGKGREGNVETLRSMCAGAGVVCEIAEPVEVHLIDQSIVRASSSLCRWLITHGRVADVARVLGRPAELTGSVVRGDRLGRTIGIPTCNIDTACAVPGNGVYAGIAHLPTGKSFQAAINISTRETVQHLTHSSQRRVEAHLLRSSDANASREWSPLPGVPEYDWPIRLEFHAFLRESVKLPGLAALQQQIARDIARVPAMLSVQGVGA